MSSRRVIASLAVLIVALTACGGGDDNSSPGAQDSDTSEAAADGTDTDVSDVSVDAPVVDVEAGAGAGCQVEATGDLQVSYTQPDDSSAFSSDYYFSAQEIEQAAGLFSDVATDVLSDFLTGFSDTGNNEEPDFTVPPRPEGTAPLTGWFLLNCQGRQMSVSLFSSGDSTSDQVPFGPGSYEIIGGALLGGNEAGKFAALVTVSDDPSTLWETGEGGTITIDRFDSSGAAGSFVIPLVESELGDTTPGTRTAEIRGTFDMTCRAGANCDR